MSPTTEYDRLMKRAFAAIYPQGSWNNSFKAGATDDCYQRAVKPDFVLPDHQWVDFKLMVSYFEKKDVLWKPSALYASVRKYIDHIANPKRRLIIVYGKCFGSIDKVSFPIMRGGKVLLADQAEFQTRIHMISASTALASLQGTTDEWIANRVQEVVSLAGKQITYTWRRQ